MTILEPDPSAAAASLLSLELGAIELGVSDLPRSVEFYRTVLGLEVLSQTRHRTELGTSERSLVVLHALAEPVPAQRPATGLYHFALLLPSRADLGRFVRRVAELGVRIGASDHLVSEAVYLHDPDGHGIEVYRDRPRGEWTFLPGPHGPQVQMATDPLDVQGVLSSAGDTRWTGLPSGTRMGHFHFKVSDQGAARDFYRQLGFERMTEFPGASFLAVGGYHHHLGLNVWESRGAAPPAPHTPALRLAHFTLKPGEFASLLARLQGVGLPLDLGEGGLELGDPSGNRLHFSPR
ncbi:glyoxalase [Deinococcus irradiatisoli]|uniref:Glyoxalase n=1 Tax=Deinococcus irradiatisoli TaxID=2202254 RepID=A0A2Z3JF48_9DEIO|nr:VOC family protein [Deinococcus irradiatisoli]AWN23783.1 glyoxalase [Deinococcus irradiatisoli]